VKLKPEKNSGIFSGEATLRQAGAAGGGWAILLIRVFSH